MKSRAIAAIAFAFSLAAGPDALADCLGKDPVSAAKAFYQAHADFYYADPAKLKDIVAPRLLKLLAMDYTCSDGQECALDSDPWVDAQDGDVSQPITYDLAEHSNDQATVVMHYIFVLSDTERSPRQVSLKLHRLDQCWQIEDMITPLGNSLADEIDKWFKEYGPNGEGPAPAKSSNP